MSDRASPNRKRQSAAGRDRTGSELKGPPPASLLTIREICALAKCSSDLLYRAIAARELPAIRLGRGRKRGRFLVRLSAFEEWLRSREEATARELRNRR